MHKRHLSLFHVLNQLHRNIVQKLRISGFFEMLVLEISIAEMETQFDVFGDEVTEVEDS